MPYIKEDQRENIVRFTCDNTGEDYAEVDFNFVGNGGDLNFLITTCISEYLEQQELSYQTISDIIGALEGAKCEFQRKIVNPYEALKEKENGSIAIYDMFHRHIVHDLSKENSNTSNVVVFRGGVEDE